jgi:hypothetical protein
MIHKLLVINMSTTTGVQIYDDEFIDMDDILLIAFMAALTKFSATMGDSKGALREAEIGQYQLSIIEKEDLVYGIIHDTYDNEDFLGTIIDRVIDKYHSLFMGWDYNQIIEGDDIPADIPDLIRTKKFPTEILPVINSKVNSFIDKTPASIDCFFLADLDDGIISFFIEPSKNVIVRLLMELLSEVPFDKHWLGESIIKSNEGNSFDTGTYEGWLIFRINDTEFCLLLRAMYSYMDKPKVLDNLQELANAIVEEIEKIKSD